MASLSLSLQPSSRWSQRQVGICRVCMCRYNKQFDQVDIGMSACFVILVTAMCQALSQSTPTISTSNPPHPSPHNLRRCVRAPGKMLLCMLTPATTWWWPFFTHTLRFRLVAQDVLSSQMRASGDEEILPAGWREGETAILAVAILEACHVR